MEIRETSLSQTDQSLYHAGDEFDEAAALFSLLLGVRIKAGGIVREFHQGEEIGWPVVEDPRAKKSIQFSPPITESEYILPWHVLRKRFDDIDFSVFQKLVIMDPLDVTALIRASRLYQESIWLSENAPEISWLLLVSAIEVAAERWSFSRAAISDVELFKYAKKALFEELSGIENGNEAIELIAKSLSGVLGATKKYREFCKYFYGKIKTNLDFPSRPETPFQIPLANKKMEKIFNQIYDFRSKALHAGTPFPKPLCYPPQKFRDGTFAEKPLGEATYSTQGVWAKDSMPIHFHVFELIIRKILIAWWSEMIEASELNSQEQD